MKLERSNLNSEIGSEKHNFNEQAIGFITWVDIESFYIRSLNFILFNFNVLAKEKVGVCLQWWSSLRKCLQQTKASREARQLPQDCDEKSLELNIKDCN